MASNKKPKKKYRPKAVIPNPVAYVLSGMIAPTETIKNRLKVAYHWAMNSLTKGEGTPEDWQEVSNSINVAMILCERGFGSEYKPSLIKAAEAMTRMKERHKKEGKALLFKSDEMRVVNEALELHDAQLEVTLVRDVELAVLEVEKRLRLRQFHKPIIASDLSEPLPQP